MKFLRIIASLDKIEDKGHTVHAWHANFKFEYLFDSVTIHMGEISFLNKDQGNCVAMIEKINNALLHVAKLLNFGANIGVNSNLTYFDICVEVKSRCQIAELLEMLSKECSLLPCMTLLTLMACEVTSNTEPKPLSWCIASVPRRSLLDLFKEEKTDPGLSTEPSSDDESTSLGSEEVKKKVKIRSKL